MIRRYVSRYEDEGRKEDKDKAWHYCELLKPKGLIFDDRILDFKEETARTKKEKEILKKFE